MTIRFFGGYIIYDEQATEKRWAVQFANYSLRQSREHTYRDVSITAQRTITILRNGQPVMRDGKPVNDVVYDITRPSNYEVLNREVLRGQLAKAGYRLARLLDEIYKQ